MMNEKECARALLILMVIFVRQVLRFPVEFGSANVLLLSFAVLKTMFVTSSDIVVKAVLSKAISPTVRILFCCRTMIQR
jgi:hypothetical protein